MKSFALTSGLRWCLPLLTVLMFASCGGDDDDNNNPADVVTSSNSGVPQNAFTATLSGAEETPPVASSATATGAVLIEPNSRLMNATIVTAGIAGNAAHIHLGAPGVSGPIIFPFAETAPGSGIWTARTIVTDAQIDVFKAGNYYFNVHSAAFPNGEIRGQIRAQLQTSTTLGTTGNRYASYTNVLSGLQAAPPSTSIARALSVTVFDSQTRTLSGAIVSVGVTGTGAHIHNAAPGLVGPVVLSLTETSLGSGIWTGKGALTELQTEALTGGNYYYDIHSTLFPEGDVRGQIVVTAASTPAAPGSAAQPATGGTASVTPGDMTGAGAPVTTSSAVPGDTTAGVTGTATPATTGVALNAPSGSPGAPTFPAPVTPPEAAPAMAPAAPVTAAVVPPASIPVVPQGSVVVIY